MNYLNWLSREVLYLNCVAKHAANGAAVWQQKSRRLSTPFAANADAVKAAAVKADADAAVAAALQTLADAKAAAKAAKRLIKTDAAVKAAKAAVDAAKAAAADAAAVKADADKADADAAKIDYFNLVNDYLLLESREKQIRFDFFAAKYNSGGIITSGNAANTTTLNITANADADAAIFLKAYKKAKAAAVKADKAAAAEHNRFMIGIWQRYHAVDKPINAAKAAAKPKAAAGNYFNWLSIIHNLMKAESRRKAAAKPQRFDLQRRLHNTESRLIKAVAKAKRRLAALAFYKDAATQQILQTTAFDRYELLLSQYQQIKAYYDDWRFINMQTGFGGKKAYIQTFAANLKAFDNITPFIKKHNAAGIKAAAVEFRQTQKAAKSKAKNYQRNYLDNWSDNKPALDMFKTGIFAKRCLVILPAAKLPALKFYDAETNTFIDRREIIAASGKDSIELITAKTDFWFALPDKQVQLIEYFTYSGKHCLRVYAKQSGIDAAVFAAELKPTPLFTGICSEYTAKPKAAAKPPKADKAKAAAKPQTVKKPLSKYSKAKAK